MKESPFNPKASYGEESREESAVRHIINTSVDEGRNTIKTTEDIAIIREALTRETEGARRVSLLKPLRAKFKTLKTDEAKNIAPVEIVNITDTLGDCTKVINTAAGRIEQRHSVYEQSTKYDRVLIGLALLKAKHLHLLPNDSSRGMGRKSKESLPTVGTDSKGGFLDWLAETHPKLKKATAYNYMYAAQNAGLTIESKPWDVARLKTDNALDHLSAKELYATPKTSAQDEADKLLLEDNNGEEPGKYSAIKDVLSQLRQESQQLLDFKDDMTPEVHETAIARLANTLAELTGTPWGPVPADQAQEYTEHPEVYELGS